MEREEKEEKDEDDILDTLTEISNEDSASSSDGYSVSQSNQDILEGDICQYCTKKISKKKIKDKDINKTIVLNKKGTHQVIYFCNLPEKCFENYDFPSARKKGVKKVVKKGGKKGGRKNN